MKIAHLILSAGASSRMARPKGLLRWKEKTFLERAYDAAVESGAFSVTAVLGAHVFEMQQEALRLNLKIIENKNWSRGMGSSIKVGVDAIVSGQSDTDGIVIQLLDQPLLTAESLAELKSHYSKTGIVCAKGENSFGPPVLFSPPYYSSLLKIEDQSGAKKVVSDNLDRVFFTNFTHRIFDVDTTADFEKLESMVRAIDNKV